jgi:drug/metabolite transporter (DMT)-like permease
MSANVAAWLFLAFAWGSTWLAVKIGLADLPPLSFAGIRFLLAALILVPVLAARRIRPPRTRSEWALVAGTALFTVSLPYGLQFWAQQYVASGLASVLTAMVPVFVLVFAHWLLPAEPMTLRKVAGVALGLAGVGVIFSDQLSSEGLLALWGSVALIVAALSLAWAQVAVKKHAGTLDPMTIAGWQMAIGTVPLLGLGLWLDGNPFEFAWTTRAILSLLYLSFVGSAAAFFVLYWLFRRMEVTKVLSVAFANPLVAVLLGWIVAGEVLSWRAVVGGLGILGGLALVLRAAPARKRARSRDHAPVAVGSGE